MSTGADCRFIERAPGRWWYRIQCWPYGETEEYDEHGPFRSEDEAAEHLHANYANPGGHSVTRYQDAGRR